jgi:DNA polymerase-3 subunit epsilon
MLEDQQPLFNDLPKLEWYDAPLAGFDLETTSPDPLTARIVSYAFITDHLNGGHAGILQPDDFEIPDEATAVHGISTQHALAVGMPREHAFYMLRNSFENAIRNRTPVVIYNAPYDLTILQREIPILDLTNLLVLDPLVLDKQFDRYRKGSRKLADVCAHYGVAFTDAAHDARADTVAAVGLARALARKHDVLRTHTITGLQASQRLWYAQHAASFERYLREKKGEKDATINREWPIRKPPKTLADVLLGDE